MEVKPAGSELAVVLEQEFGTVEFKGSQGETPDRLRRHAGGAASAGLVRVPVGKYEIRTMQDGKILNRQDVEVTSANHERSHGEKTMKRALAFVASAACAESWR